MSKCEMAVQSSSTRDINLHTQVKASTSFSVCAYLGFVDVSDIEMYATGLYSPFGFFCIKTALKPEEDASAEMTVSSLDSKRVSIRLRVSSSLVLLKVQGRRKRWGRWGNGPTSFRPQWSLDTPTNYFTRPYTCMVETLASTAQLQASMPQLQAYV